MGERLLVGTPITLEFSRWYGARSLFMLLVFGGLALYAFHTSLGGKPIFGRVSLEET